MTKLRTILENIEYHWSQPHYNIFKSLYINFRCLPLILQENFLLQFMANVTFTG